jgi:cell division protein FtsI/penicillin-binding protein 2
MAHRFKEKKKSHSSRIIIVGIIFFIFWIIIIGRLAQLQIINYRQYQAQAEGLRVYKGEEIAERGEIFVQERDTIIPVAMNNYSYNLIAVPNNIKNPEETVNKIAGALNETFDSNSSKFQEIITKVSKKDDWYEILYKKLTQASVEKIKKLFLDGIYFEKEVERYYPEKNDLSNLLGFYGYEGDQKTGRYGLEEYYNDVLSGKEGLVEGELARTGVLIPTAENIIKDPQDGSDIVLTIDRTIQNKACEIINATVDKYKAAGGTVIVVNPKTGEIIALCNVPNFDPNNYTEVNNAKVYNNGAVSYQYEPGSVFKVITFAAALEDGKIKPDTPFEDKGVIRIDNYNIRNAGDEVYGKINMKTVLEKSVNTGAIFAAQQVGISRFSYFVKKFGFGQKTEIDSPGEAKGDLKNLSLNRSIYLATASFGQGIAVTPIQMVMSFAAVANHGKLMKPYLVKEIISQKNTFKNEPQEVNQVISASTAITLRDLMISAVENGWGKRAMVSGYRVAGKTGTAEVPGLKGYQDQTVHSFIGFAPADNPRFVALVKLDDPQTSLYSDQTATPAFGQLADFILKYYQIPPTEKNK